MISFIVLLGALMIVAGIVLFAYDRNSSGVNKIKMFGGEFSLSHPSLVIVLLGFLLVIADSGLLGNNSKKDLKWSPQGLDPTAANQNFGNFMMAGATTTSINSPASNSDCPEITVRDFSKYPMESKIERRCF